MPPVKVLACASILATLLVQPAFAQDTFSSPDNGSVAPSTGAAPQSKPQTHPGGQPRKHRRQHARSGDPAAQQAPRSNGAGQRQKRQNWRQAPGATPAGLATPGPASGST